ncbi:hypothetical protein EZS27_015862 [termite gut metagenome]|uniref:DUF1896 domain-containing protein n=1 Tax=termite gut metagenome TaxID=433724 RepID=A0A5J4RQJ8_9ZZZZ
MKRKKQTQELSYYGLLLLSYLRESHPGKMNDTEFISIRAHKAAESYSDAIKAGYSPVMAEEIASGILYEGLLFSKYDTIRNILWNEYPMIAEKEADKLALKLLSPSEEVFSEYHLTDEFASSPEYTLLYTELTGFIDVWRDEHGL